MGNYIFLRELSFFTGSGYCLFVGGTRTVMGKSKGGPVFFSGSKVGTKIFDGHRGRTKIFSQGGYFKFFLLE